MDALYLDHLLHHEQWASLMISMMILLLILWGGSENCMALFYTFLFFRQIWCWYCAMQPTVFPHRKYMQIHIQVNIHCWFWLHVFFINWYLYNIMWLFLNKIRSPDFSRASPIHLYCNTRCSKILHSHNQEEIFYTNKIWSWWRTGETGYDTKICTVYTTSCLLTYSYPFKNTV